MVKFGKSYRKRYVNEWEDHYINYKQLKQKIKEIMNNLQSNEESTIIRENPNQESFGSSSANLLNSLTVLYDRPNGHHLKAFIKLLDKEFKKAYVFFVSMEKELYKKINLHLYIKQSYHTFSIKEVHEEVTSIWFTIYLALSLLRFINDNMMAMKNILKKFDKKFNETFGFISFKYLTQKLSNSNSDLDYLLHFKVIDETSAITESLTKTLKFIYKHEKKMPIDQILFTENKSFIQSKEEVLVIPTEDLISQIKVKFKEIKGYVIRIDESNLFRVQYRELMSYINDNDKITKNSPNTLDNDMYNPLLSCTLINDSIMEKFISWNVNTSIKYHETSLSTKNKINVVFCFAHTFLYNMIYTSIIPSNSLYLSKNYYDQYLCGIIFAMTPLLSLLSILIFQIYIQRKYKLPFVISYTLLFVGSILYALTNNESWPNYLMMLLGRSVIGLGSAPIMPKTYITSYVSKYYLPKISHLYIIISASGLCSGPLICLGLSTIKFKIRNVIVFNEFTNVGWFGAAFSMLSLIFNLLFFSDPFSSSFSMLNIDKDDEYYKENLTFSNVPILSQEEKRMINQIDTRLDQFNDDNNFTNINLIPNELDKIVQREQSGLHYFSKNISIVLSLLFVARLLCEGLIIRPIDPKLNKLKIELTHYYWLVIGIYFAQIIPYIFVNQLSYHNRIFKYSLMTALGIGILLSIVFCFTYSIEECYYSIIILLSLLACILEISICSLISLILPPKWTFLKVNSSYLIPIVITLGKVAGPISLSIIKQLQVYYFVILGFSSVVFLSIIILLLIYSDFRVKAIAKILRNQISSKMMME